MPVKRRFVRKSRRVVKKRKMIRDDRRAKRSRSDVSNNAIVEKVNAMYRMIETKEGCWRTSPNISLAHNDVTVLQSALGGALNPIATSYNTNDPLGAGGGSRIGDKISVRGIAIRAFFENALSRSKVYYRLMLVKCAKGDTINRANLFKQNSNNKMIDQINTERFTILASRTFNVQPPVGGYAASGVDLAGVPTGVVYAGLCTKTIYMWVPGRKFGVRGVITYEDATTQCKFYDYRLVVVAYDWFGTPQDINSVGKINELYTKMYFKDA